jgi:speckle-type POZ protein
MPKFRRRDTLLESVADDFDSKIFSDLTILCSDGKLQAHRNIIAARSSVFKTLTTKAAAKKSKQISANNVDIITMHEVLRFIYTKKVENLDALAPKLLFCADKYDLPQLKVICAETMIEQLTQENVFENLSLATDNNSERLKRGCVEFINR